MGVKRNNFIQKREDGGAGKKGKTYYADPEESYEGGRRE